MLSDSQESDIDSLESLLVPDKYRGGCSQPTIGLNTGSLIQELEKRPKDQKGFAPIGGTTILTPPELPGAKPPSLHMEGLINPTA